MIMPSKSQSSETVDIFSTVRGKDVDLSSQEGPTAFPFAEFMPHEGADTPPVASANSVAVSIPEAMVPTARVGAAAFPVSQVFVGAQSSDLNPESAQFASEDIELSDIDLPHAKRPPRAPETSELPELASETIETPRPDADLAVSANPVSKFADEKIEATPRRDSEIARTTSASDLDAQVSSVLPRGEAQELARSSAQAAPLLSSSQPKIPSLPPVDTGAASRAPREPLTDQSDDAGPQIPNTGRLDQTRLINDGSIADISRTPIRTNEAGPVANRQSIPKNDFPPLPTPERSLQPLTDHATPRQAAPVQSAVLTKPAPAPAQPKPIAPQAELGRQTDVVSMGSQKTSGQMEITVPTKGNAASEPVVFKGASETKVTRNIQPEQVQRLSPQQTMSKDVPQRRPSEVDQAAPGPERPQVEPQRNTSPIAAPASIAPKPVALPPVVPTPVVQTAAGPSTDGSLQLGDIEFSAREFRTGTDTPSDPSLRTPLASGVMVPTRIIGHGPLRPDTSIAIGPVEGGLALGKEQIEFGVLSPTPSGGTSSREMPVISVSTVPPPQVAVPVPVATQIAQSIAAAEGPQIEVKLSPEELGTVRIVMSARDSGMQVTVFAERSETLEVLKNDEAGLQADLESMGFSGSDLSFEQESPDENSEQTNQIDDGLAQTDLNTTTLVTNTLSQTGIDIRF